MKLILARIAIVCLAACILTPAFAQGSGADTYKAQCALCHGEDGLAATPVGKAFKAASFKNPTVVKTPDAALMAIVKSGKDKMPSFSAKLTDAQIKDVVDYIRTLEKK